MASAIALADESMPYGCTRGMNAALDAHFAKSDPRAARQAKANSPGARRNRNALERTPDDILLETLLKRVRARRKRELARERQRRRRDRLSRKTA